MDSVHSLYIQYKIDTELIVIRRRTSRLLEIERILIHTKTIYETAHSLDSTSHLLKKFIK